MKRDLIVFGLICLAFYIGVTMTHGIMKRNEQVAIKNAIATFEPSPLTCKDNDIIQAIGKLAENGAHINGYTLWLDMGDSDD
jgi:hypothetical protein